MEDFVSDRNMYFIDLRYIGHLCDLVMHQNRSVLPNKFCKTRYVTSIFDVSQ